MFLFRSSLIEKEREEESANVEDKIVQKRIASVTGSRLSDDYGMSNVHAAYLHEVEE